MILVNNGFLCCSCRSRLQVTNEQHRHQVIFLSSQVTSQLILSQYKVEDESFFFAQVSPSQGSFFFFVVAVLCNWRLFAGNWKVSLNVRIYANCFDSSYHIFPKSPFEKYHRVLAFHLLLTESRRPKVFCSPPT